MGNIGDPITPAIPPVGSTGPDYAADYNTIMAEVVTRLTARIPYSSLLLSGPLDLGGNALTNASYASFVTGTGTPASSPPNRWVSSNGDIWWVGTSGPVQITAGGVLSAGSLGGIEGDYGGVAPAKLRYNAAGARFEAYHNFSTNTWASYRGLGLDIVSSTNPSVAFQHRYAGSATRTVTWPATLPTNPSPTATTVLTVDNNGQIGHGTLTGVVTVDAAGVVNVAGVINLSGSLNVTNDIFLDTAGDIKHGPRTYTIPSASGAASDPGTTVIGNKHGGVRVIGGGAPTFAGVVVPLPVKPGDRILSVTVARRNLTTANLIQVFRVDAVDPDVDHIIGTATPSTSIPWVDVPIVCTPTVMGARDTLALWVNVPAASGDCFLNNITVEYDRPV